MTLKIKYSLFIFLLLITFIICANFSFAAGSLPALDNSAKKDVKVILEGCNPESGQDNHEHKEGEKDEHISQDHEKLELFHAEYYSMPWRSKQTQNDLWYIMIFLAAVNFFFLIIFRRKMRSKYKIGKGK